VEEAASSTEDLDFEAVSWERIGFAADSDGLVLEGLPFLNWLRTFGVIRNRRASGNSINRAVRLLILEKSLPCPMP
jgi:hypothetical protein